MMKTFMNSSLACDILGWVSSRLGLHLVPTSKPHYRLICFVIDEIISIPCGLFSLAAMSWMLSDVFAKAVAALFGLTIVVKMVLLYFGGIESL
ncbi:unnamed protein product [Arabis nemorensis]|uniref:Uncharacterized protein n=1 Tax=Arabis nemorensis TaxID=586526 RepID=A0A565CT58_9BRAS|nr:unnamed protein product [Arabis nemorensis]